MLKLIHCLVWMGILMMPGIAGAQEFDVNKCIEDGLATTETQTRCYTEETKHILAKIEMMYQKHTKDPFYATYHDGPARTEEVLKKTFNAWKLYVKYYCNLVGYNSKDSGQKEVDGARAECLRELSKQHLDLIHSLEDRGMDHTV